MAPRRKIQRQQLVDAAFNIANEEGYDKITIRKVADLLGCSIAPIYANFSDVESLKLEVQEKAVKLLQGIYEQQNNENIYLKRGIANLIFASKYPLIFQDIILSRNPRLYSEESDKDYLKQVRNDPQLGKLSDEQLRTLMYRLYIFHVGLVVLAANEVHAKRLPLNEAIQTLEESGYDMINGMVQRLNKEQQESEDAIR